MRWRPCANPHFSGDSVGAGGTDDDAKTDEPAQEGTADSSALKKAAVPVVVPVARLEARRELMLFKRSSCAALRTQLNSVFFGGSGGGGIPAEHLGIAKAPSFGKFEVAGAAKLRWDEDVKAAASATGSPTHCADVSVMNSRSW